jgi:hypothetical protein
MPDKSFFGKYRGTVVDNVDPSGLGRVKVKVPAVSELKTSVWAMPCVPIAGVQSGFFVLPPVGSQVWVEFEAGQVADPIWTGGYWPSASEVPAVSAASPGSPGQTVVLRTVLQNTIAISDGVPTSHSGGIILESAGGASIIVNDTGIYISNGKGASVSLVGAVTTIEGLKTHV